MRMTSRLNTRASASSTIASFTSLMSSSNQMHGPSSRAEVYNSYEDGQTTCHPETRIEILHQIQEWAQQSCGKNIYWLSGVAGTGKSTGQPRSTTDIKEGLRSLFFLFCVFLFALEPLAKTGAGRSLAAKHEQRATDFCGLLSSDRQA
jgi:hypothetical protein